MQVSRIHLLSFVIIVLIGCVNLNGQGDYTKTVVPGNKWKLVIDNGSHFNSSVHWILITCDTFHVNGWIYHSVELSGGERCGPGGLIREDTLEQKVYFINRDNQDNWDEILIADYSLVEGDTFAFENGWGRQVVKNVSYKNYLGGPLVKIIDFGVHVMEVFAEGHGRTRTGILNDCRPVSYPRLNGYEKIDLNCNALTNTSPLPKDGVLTVSPNPVTDQLRIEYNGKMGMAGFKFELISSFGRIVKKGQLDTENMIFMHDLPKGTYFLVVQGEGRRIVSKIIHI